MLSLSHTHTHTLQPRRKQNKTKKRALFLFCFVGAFRETASFFFYDLQRFVMTLKEEKREKGEKSTTVGLE